MTLERLKMVAILFEASPGFGELGVLVLVAQGVRRPKVITPVPPSPNRPFDWAFGKGHFPPIPLSSLTLPTS